MASLDAQQDQLLELLLQLKKASPDDVRTILNPQPKVAYALMPLMVSIGAISVEAVQRTLSQTLPTPAASTSAPVQPNPALAPPPRYGPPPVQPVNMHQQAMQPPSAIPPHLAGQPNRGGTPPYGYGSPPPYARGGTPTYGRNAPVHAPQPPVAPTHAAPYPYPPSQAHPQQPYGVGQGPPPSFGLPPPQQPQLPPQLQETLATIPDEQKPYFIRVVSMTPEEIQHLPPQERGNTIQLRQALGLPV